MLVPRNQNIEDNYSIIKVKKKFQRFIVYCCKNSLLQYASVTPGKRRCTGTY